jgi:hypothetical protein
MYTLNVRSGSRLCKNVKNLRAVEKIIDLYTDKLDKVVFFLKGLTIYSKQWC